MYILTIQNKRRNNDENQGYDEGSDLLDDLEWLPDNHELKAVLYQGKNLKVSTWEELRKHVSG